MRTETQKENSNPLQGVRVLVVEDNWQVANALRLALTDVGIVVTGSTSTAYEAKRITLDGKPDLVLVDLNLKGEMAFELVDWLRHHGLRVIVLSGYGAETTSRSNADAVLQKPYSSDELFATLQKVALAASSKARS
jgi:DNA-binding response OmpR family regulator